jgi:RimJ/RimL family protein N-acetyltransferase
MRRDRLQGRAEVSIVPVAEAHIRGYHEAVDRVARERRYLAFLEALPLEKSAAFVRENIAQGNPHVVALIGGEVVGWCDICPVNRPVYAHGGVLGMGIVEEHRGKGLGEALMRAALAQARACGLTRVELTVRADNPRAIALYRKIGFVDEGVKRKAIFVDGAYVDVACMALLFEDLMPPAAAG